MTKVFVYGTLMRQQGLNDLMARVATFYSTGILSGYKMYMVRRAPFPTIIASDEEGVYVEGEVWETDDSGIRTLDRIEGFKPEMANRSLYVRQQVLVAVPSQAEPLAVQTYVKGNARVNESLTGTDFRKMSDKYWRRGYTDGSLA